MKGRSGHSGVVETIPREDGMLVDSSTFSELGFCFGETTLEPGSVDLVEVYHSDAEFMYVIQGASSISLGGVDTHVHAGQVVYIEPGTWHSLSNHGNEVFRAIYIFNTDVRPLSKTRKRNISVDAKDLQ